jgi:putative acetyltransferase
MTRLVEASWPSDRKIVEELFREYANSIDADICFQGFEQELGSLPGKYAAPDGCVLLASADENWAGCVALRSLGNGICEMKRLYVRPNFRGRAIGRILVEDLIGRARLIGYSALRLDTLPSMQAAQSLYADLGFKTISPYYENPIAGVAYLELKL